MKAGGGGRLLPPAALREPRRPARSSRRHDRPPCRPATRREPIDGLMSSDGPSFRRPPCPCQRFRHSFGNIPYAGTRLGASIAAVQIIFHASRRRGRKEMREGHPPSVRVSFETFECRRTDITRWQVGDDDSRGFLGRGTDLPRSSRPARGCCGRVLRPAAAAGPAGVRCLPSSSWRSGSRLGNALRTTRLPRGRATPPDGRSAEAVTERLLDLGTGRPCPLDQIRTLQRGGGRGTLRMIRSEAEP